MKREDLTLLRHLHQQYVNAHAELNRLCLELERIDGQRQEVRKILDETRESERVLINKLEKEMGKTITPDDLIEIIKTNDF
ncbi:hypothetical protein UFOVP699_83 [uncultured Caudovirales phage]|uniref:Uncharacterized protein n=1 Tax=uncultured Caudovirales phage TaxID=2100421 RepID=A0A6J5NVQ9_9CAUD|nr:hypothetical protein UFOVP699_83 [uncultured Caudovirales phage]